MVKEHFPPPLGVGKPDDTGFPRPLSPGEGLIGRVDEKANKQIVIAQENKDKLDTIASMIIDLSSKMDKVIEVVSTLKVG